MFQLCVVWLCLPNLKETLVKGEGALEPSIGTVRKEEPSQGVYHCIPLSLVGPGLSSQSSVLPQASCVQCLEPDTEVHI